MQEFKVSGMSCAACSARVERAVQSLSGVDSCSVNLLTGSMSVESSCDAEIIIGAVRAAGYDACLKSSRNAINVNNNDQNSEQKRITLRLIVSLILLVPLMYLSMGYVMWNAPLPSALSKNPVVIAVIQAIISGVILIINRRFFISGGKAALHLSPNMDTLVALGSGVSYLYSIYTLIMMTVKENPHHYLHSLYFESAAMILTLITVGKMLETRAKGRTTDAIRSLMDLSPKSATVIRGGTEILIPVSEVVVGDIFLVRPGESVAVDGVVLEGESSVNEAALTGESVPSDKKVGDKVLAATVNQSGFLKCRAEGVGENTAIASVIRMVEEASSTKAPIAKLADRVSGIFVPIVMAIAIVTFIVWQIVGGNTAGAVSKAISVLVISCPCSLGLATPVAIMVGSGVGAKFGILFKNAEALELTGRAKIIALDKTGTITRGEPRVTDVISDAKCNDARLLAYAYAIERFSEHPLAAAVTAYAEKYDSDIAVDSFCNLSGSGVRAMTSEGELCGGSYGFISGKCDLSEFEDHYERITGEGKTPLFFSLGGAPLGLIAVADTLRDDSREAISKLSSMGLRVVMLTGDNQRTALAIGRAAGVDEVRAELLPDAKAHAVKEFSADATVIMVGDGINDAPALTQADVGMAIGGGTDIAIESANLVLMRDSLNDVVRAVRLGRAVLTNIRENLFWAFIYNAVGIPLAAGVFGLTLNPMFGAAAMSLSSFCVVMNALRLNAFDLKYNKTKKNSHKRDEKQEKIMTITLKIEGMMCPHCEARVRDALSALDCVDSCQVSHADGTAIITHYGECSVELATKTVTDAGYKVISAE